MSTALIQIVLRKGTAAAWTSADPTLESGEIGYETDTGYYKWGDGTTAWSSLDYDHSFGRDLFIAETVDVGHDMIMTEQADHSSAPTAARGIYWVKAVASGATPMFTDDGGLDYELNDRKPNLLLIGA